MVDTAGNQLPHVPKIREDYAPEREVVNLRILNGEVVFMQQAPELNDVPLLQVNENRRGRAATLAPTPGKTPDASFKRYHKDPIPNAIVGDVQFSKAMSPGMDRAGIEKICILATRGRRSRCPPNPRR